jgi:hypothetical protein
MDGWVIWEAGERSPLGANLITFSFPFSYFLLEGRIHAPRLATLWTEDFLCGGSRQGPLPVSFVFSLGASYILLRSERLLTRLK